MPSGRIDGFFTVSKWINHRDGYYVTALHLANRPRPGGALLPGDALQVVMDRRHVSFMYSYPNLVPMRTHDVVAMRDRLAKYSFEDVYGFTWGRTIIGGGREAVNASFDRHLRAVNG